MSSSPGSRRPICARSSVGRFGPARRRRRRSRRRLEHLRGRHFGRRRRSRGRRAASRRRRSRARAAPRPPRSARSAACRRRSGGLRSASVSPAGARTSSETKVEPVGARERQQLLEQADPADEQVDVVDVARRRSRDRPRPRPCRRAASRGPGRRGSRPPGSHQSTNAVTRPSRPSTNATPAKRFTMRATTGRASARRRRGSRCR